MISNLVREGVAGLTTTVSSATRRAIGGMVLVTVAGCGSATVTDGTDGISSSPVPSRSASEIPAGHGTLRQDEFTVSLRDGPLQIKVTPLAEAVIRLAAPDTYERLRALAESRRAQAASATTGSTAPSLFLVSFFSTQPDVPFEPDDLQLVYQGRLLRPSAVLALTPTWGTQRLLQRETQTALYVFDEPLDLDLPFTVRYGFQSSDAWSQILTRLRVERAKVRARTGS